MGKFDVIEQEITDLTIEEFNVRQTMTRRGALWQGIVAGVTLRLLKENRGNGEMV